MPICARMTTMGIAGRMRVLRIRAGLSHGQMAQRLELNVAWYADLERHDGELAATLSVFKAMELASLLGVRLHELLGLAPDTVPQVALFDLPQLILARVRRDAISVSQLEQRLGWELADFIASPLQALAALPLQFLQDLAAVLEVSLQALIPDQSVD
jgi:transcriptional regulator with XRE-family HTH domain